MARPTPPSNLKLIAVSLAATVALLLLAELACRLFGFGGPVEVESKRKVERYIADWEYQWEDDFYLVDGGEGFNQDGVRDYEHRLENSEGNLRIACLGDSVTAGYLIPFPDSYPATLERLLREAGGKAEVFNVALPGWSARQERRAYGLVARKYQPDHVILAFCLNDVPEMHNNLSRPSPLLSAGYRNSCLVRTIIRPRQKEIYCIEELFNRPDAEKVVNGWNLYLNEVRKLAREVKRDGACFTLLAVPFRYQLGPDGPPPLVQEKLEKFCRENGINYLDALPALRPGGREAFVDYSHLSPLGSNLIARAIIESGFLAKRCGP